MLVAGDEIPAAAVTANDPGFGLPARAEQPLRRRYQTRISGPLLDRIDLNIEVPAVTASDLILPPPAEGSKEVAARVARPARPSRALRGSGPHRHHDQRRCAVGAARRRGHVRTARAWHCFATAADAMRCRRAAIIACCGCRAPLADLDAREKIGRVHLARL